MAAMPLLPGSPLATTPESKFHPRVSPGIHSSGIQTFCYPPAKSTHAKLSERARAEGVSLNALVLAMIAVGLGRREKQG